VLKMPAISQSIDTSTDILNKITTGNVKWPEEYTLANFLSIFTGTNSRWHTPIAKNVEHLSSTEKVNLIQYLRAFFKTSPYTSELELQQLRDTIRLFHKLFQNVNGFDEHALRETKALTDLFRVLAQNSRFVGFQAHLVHDFLINTQQFGSHLGSVIKNIASDSEYTTRDFLAPYLNAIRSFMDQSAYIEGGYQQLAKALTEIGDSCLSVTNCQHSARLSEIFTSLAILYHKNNANNKPYLASDILDEVVAFMERVKTANSDQLDENEIKKLAVHFSQQAYSGQALDDILQRCAQVFNLDDCHVLPETTTTEPTSIFTSNSTSTTTSAPSEQTETTTLTSSSEQTTTDTTNEQTTADAYLPAKSHLLEKIGASAITGLTQGMKSELFNVLLKVCLEKIKDKPPLIKHIVQGTFALVEAASTAALPILYNFAYNLMLAEDEQDPLSDNELYTSIIISAALQALGAAFYLIPNSKFKTVLGYLHMPLVALYMFANLGNKTEAAITWATSSAAAMAGKAAVQLTSNRFMVFSTSNNRNNALPSDAEEGTELRLLSSPTESSNSSNRGSDNSHTTSSTFTDSASSNRSASSPDSSELPLKLTRFVECIKSSKLETKDPALQVINSLNDNWKKLVKTVNNDIKKCKSNNKLVAILTTIKGDLTLIQNQLNQGPSYPSAPIENCHKSLELAQNKLNELITTQSFTDLHIEKPDKKSLLTPLIGHIQKNVIELLKTFRELENEKIKRAHKKELHAAQQQKTSYGQQPLITPSTPLASRRPLPPLPKPDEKESIYDTPKGTEPIYDTPSTIRRSVKVDNKMDHEHSAITLNRQFFTQPPKSITPSNTSDVIEVSYKNGHLSKP
jgi:hypothetical protein